MAARAITPPKKATAKPATPSQLPLFERVKARAYEIYLQRGGQDGSDMDDWLQAEDEIRAEENGALSRAEGEGMVARK